jgi:hypothetical protein
MLRRSSFCLSGISTLAILLSICAVAQESGPPNKSAAQATQPDDKSKAQRESDRPLEAYHLQFTLSEIEDNRTINTRQYALDLSTNEANDLKVGTRVPFESKQDEFQYLDLGTHIHARVEDRHGQTTISVIAEMSSFALDDQDKHDTHPLIRQIKIDASTLLQLNKPVVMGIADDPSSKRRFQLEMTATRLM